LGIIHGMRNHRTIAGLAFVTTLVFLLQPEAAPAVPNRVDPSCDKAPTKIRWSEKHVLFDMRGKPWREVLDWFADQTGVPVERTRLTPKGKFTFVSPKDEPGKPCKNTLVEIFDILNEILQTEHHVTLVRGDNTLTLVSVDESWMVPIPRVKLEDLPDRSRRDIVEIEVTLRPGLNAKDHAADFKRALGTFGRVTPIDERRVIVQGSVRSLRRILPDFCE
jgi:hypothetical protein